MLVLDGGSQYTPRQLDALEIENDRIYRHKVLRVNYTTYDMRRDQDVINPRTHADIMMLAEDHAPHRFLYGRVIDIFHARVSYTGPGATREMRRFHRMDFLRVRWFEIDEDYDAGFQERRMPRLRFVDYERSEDAAFGFVDPNLVLRAAFIIPAFDLGISMDLLPPSTLARRASDNDEDYAFYYSCL